MQSFDDTFLSGEELATSTLDMPSTGALEQLSGAYSQRVVQREDESQQKNTDVLPPLGAGMDAISTPASQQILQLREENSRLRSLLAETEKEREQLHSVRQQEIERYEQQLQEEIEAYRQLDMHYQELYHSFQDAVEEEAHTLVLEVSQALSLHPDDRSLAASETLHTLEGQIRQMADQHIAEALYVTRQSQRKVAQLEHELAQEYQQLATERENLLSAQNSVRRQVEQRRSMMEARLRAKYTFSRSLLMLCFLLMPVLQILCLSILHLPTSLPLYLTLFAPVFLYIVMGLLFGRVRDVLRLFAASVPHPHKEAMQHESH